MKTIGALACAFLMAGCAGQKPIKAKPAIPLSCVTNLDQSHAHCRQVSDSLAECSGVMVRFACVKYSK